MRIVLTVLALSLLAPAAASACAPVRDPYPGTRYAGQDLTHIRVDGASCATARRVAKGAHRSGLAKIPGKDGVRRFTWKGWTVRGDLKPAHDRYLAAKGSVIVRWRF